MKPFILTLAFCTLISPAIAGDLTIFQGSDGTSGTVLDFGGPTKFYQDNRGTSGTIMDLGGGYTTYQDNRGRSGSIVNLGGGIRSFSDNRGTSGTVQSLGGGFQSYQDNRGTTGTIIDLGGGVQTYQFNTPRTQSRQGLIQNFGRKSVFIAFSPPHPRSDRVVVATGFGRPASTCEAHRSRQHHCHSRRVILSGPPAPSSASWFLPEMCVGSPVPVREPTSFQQRRNSDGYPQQTREHAAMWQHQSDDLAEQRPERAVLLHDLFPPVQGSVRLLAQWDLVRPPRHRGLNDRRA